MVDLESLKLEWTATRLRVRCAHAQVARERDLIWHLADLRADGTSLVSDAQRTELNTSLRAAVRTAAEADAAAEAAQAAYYAYKLDFEWQALVFWNKWQ